MQRAIAFERQVALSQSRPDGKASEGRRASCTFANGTPLVIGGKTGTGDNRYRVFGPGGGVRESRIVNRTATFVSLAGARYFGVIVAYVPGGAAESFGFTSTLPTQVLRVLGPRLCGLVAPPSTSEGP